MWKLNDDLFTSTKPYDVNTTGNVSTASAFLRACQKNTLELTFLFIVAVFSFVVVALCLSFSVFLEFGCMFSCCVKCIYLTVLIEWRFGCLG